MAQVKIIRSEADYQAALTELERLWGARLGTPDGDRLDVLATLIDAYEAEHDPMDPPQPQPSSPPGLERLLAEVTDDNCHDEAERAKR